jgi:hypothetical protein
MLKRLLYWNVDVIRRLSIATWLSFQVLIGSAMIYSYVVDKSQFEGDNSFAIIMLFTFPFLATFGVFFISFLPMFYNQYLREKAFGSYPFCELKSIGFAEVVSKNRWKENHNYLQGVINDYIIDFDSSDGYYGKLVFRFYIKDELMDYDEFDKVFEGFSDYKAIYNGYSVDLCFHRKKHGFSTFLEFRNELNSFSEYLKKSKLKPELLEDIRR